MVVNCCAASVAATAVNPFGSFPLNRPHKVQYEVHALLCGLHTGVFTGVRPSDLAMCLVSCAM